MTNTLHFSKPGDRAVLHWKGRIAPIFLTKVSVDRGRPQEDLGYSGVARYTFEAIHLINDLEDYDHEHGLSAAHKLAHAVLAGHDTAALALADEVQMAHVGGRAMYLTRPMLVEQVRDLQARCERLEAELASCKTNPNSGDSDDIW